MMDEAQTTIRNAGFLLIQRALFILGSLFFAFLVPRLMGPQNYGRYALLTSLYLWFLVAGDLGYSEVMGRYIPQFKLQGDHEKLKKFFNNLLAVSIACGALSAGIYGLLTAWWLTDFKIGLILTMAATLFVRAGTRPFFPLFLGLNQVARWGMGEIFRHWLLLILVIIGFYFYKLEGALFGILLAELAVLAMGIYWGKSYLSYKAIRLDIAYLIPYLKFGFMFFLFNFLGSAFQQSGTILVKLFYPDYRQVSYFGLANNIYLTFSSVIPCFTISFIPFLIVLQNRGKRESVQQWIERLINGLTVGGMFVVFGILLLGNDLVPWVLGSDYRPVAFNLIPLSISLLFQILGSTAVLLTVVYNLPRMAVLSAAIRLTALWIFGPLLVTKWRSLGGCISVLLASICFGGFLIHSMQKIVSFSLRKWIGIILLGLLFTPLYWLKSSWPINFLLYLLFVAGYGLLFFLFRFFKPSDVATLWEIFRAKNKMPDELPRNEHFGP